MADVIIVDSQTVAKRVCVHRVCLFLSSRWLNCLQLHCGSLKMIFTQERKEDARCKNRERRKKRVTKQKHPRHRAHKERRGWGRKWIMRWGNNLPWVPFTTQTSIVVLLMQYIIQSMCKSRERRIKQWAVKCACLCPYTLLFNVYVQWSWKKREKEKCQQKTRYIEHENCVFYLTLAHRCTLWITMRGQKEKRERKKRQSERKAEAWRWGFENGEAVSSVTRVVTFTMASEVNESN